jgi:phosphoribosylformylglycinamidine cyclo-ligase
MVRPLLDRIKGMAHITGGGITENLPRVLPHGTAAVVNTSAWDVPPLFRWLEHAGRVPADDMRRTFNMGIGMILVVGRERADAALEELAARGGRDARIIGEVVAGDAPVVTYTQPS